MTPDLSHLRADFPILEREINGKPLAFLDSAASSQRPCQVLEAMNHFSSTSYANVHRGAYTLAAEATDAYEEARRKVANFINATDPSEVVFTRGTTSGINALAWSWGGDRLEQGDRVVITAMEHHANIVPWQQVCRRTGAELVYSPLDDDYQLDLEVLESKIDERAKIVSLTGMSNVLGSIPPLKRVADLAHAVGAVVIVDAAQLVSHAPVNVQDLDIDFLVFSAHKMLGPTGVGVMWGRASLLEEMEPFETGGEMISDVQLYEATWAPIPHKFEAGTPPIVEAIGLGAAIDYLDAIGMDVVRRHDMNLTSLAMDRLSEVQGVTVYGPRNIERRGGAISFTMADIHAHDLATILDEEGVAVRAGHHCAKPLLRDLGVPATARASFSVYSVPSDIEALITGLVRAGEIFGVGNERAAAGR